MAHSQEILLPALYVLACVFALILRQIFIRQNQLAEVIFATQTYAWFVCKAGATLGLVKRDPATSQNTETYLSVGPLVRRAMFEAGVKLGDKIAFSINPSGNAGAAIESFRCSILERQG